MRLNSTLRQWRPAYALGAAALLFMPGCKPEVGPQSLARIKKPGFVRVFNASDEPLKVSLNGNAFGNGYAPGEHSAFTRLPPKPVQVRLEFEKSGPADLQVEVAEGNGYTVYATPSHKGPRYTLVSGDSYGAEAGKCTIRATVLDPATGWKVALESGVELFGQDSGELAGPTVDLDPGTTSTVVVQDAKGRTIAQQDALTRPGHSYTALVRKVNGKPVVKIIDNNPPLSPRGRMGFSQGS